MGMWFGNWVNLTALIFRLCFRQVWNTFWTNLTFSKYRDNSGKAASWCIALIHKQECIPVECMPTAVLTATWCLWSEVCTLPCTHPYTPSHTHPLYTHSNFTHNPHCTQSLWTGLWQETGGTCTVRSHVMGWRGLRPCMVRSSVSYVMTTLDSLTNPPLRE